MLDKLRFCWERFQAWIYRNTVSAPYDDDDYESGEA